MRIRYAFFLLVAVFCLTQAKKQTRTEKKWSLTAEKLEKVRELWAKYGPDYSAYKKTEHQYPCGPIPSSSEVPTSVHKLRPGDIKVIGAMGDSLTAGTGIEATNVIEVLIQNRGMSWSGGGETNFADQITLPNILKKFTDDIYGFATGDGDEDSRRSHFNVAVSGSTSEDLVNQARELIDRMKENENVDFDNDWKIVTILSGNNDVCDYCSDVDVNAKNYRKNLIAALDILHSELPRTLVNLVVPLNLEILTELNKGLICSTLHFFVCDCAAFPKDEAMEDQLIHEVDMFQQTVMDIALSGQYDTKDDFTVVSQPFYNDTYIPRTVDDQPDLSYFAPDCFHLSQKGQAAAATALWNNMIEPVHSKRTAWTPGENIECPTEEKPYFFTNKNSNQNFQTRNFQQGPKQTVEDAGSKFSVAGVVVGVTALAVAVVIAALVVKQKRGRYTYRPIRSSEFFE